MKLTEEERRELDEFMENPYYREIVEKAPNEACRDYIIHGLIYGFYCGDDPEQCRESLEEGLKLDDWKYICRNLAGNTPFRTKCTVRIRELEGKEAGAEGGNI